MAEQPLEITNSLDTMKPPDFVSLFELTRDPFDKGIKVPNLEEGDKLCSPEDVLFTEVEPANEYFGKVILDTMVRTKWLSGAIDFSQSAISIEYLNNNYDQLMDRLDSSRRTLDRLLEDEGIVSQIEKLQLPEELRTRITQNGGLSLLKGLAESSDSDLIAFMQWNKDNRPNQKTYVGGQVLDDEDEYYANYYEPGAEPTKLEKLIIDCLKDFEKSMIRAEEKQKFPGLHSFDGYGIRARLIDVHIMIGDPLLADISGEYGHYQPREKLILINKYDVDNPEDLKETLFHELVHHISGGTLVSSGDVNGIHEDGANTASLKHGLSAHGRLRWLDEAVTEQLTQLLVNGANTDFTALTAKDIASQPEWNKGLYKDYRTAMLGLMQGSDGMITFGDLLGAYFENYVPPISPERKKLAEKDALYALDEDYGLPSSRIRLYDKIDFAYGFDKDFEDILYGLAEEEPIKAAIVFNNLKSSVT